MGRPEIEALRAILDVDSLPREVVSVVDHVHAALATARAASVS
jgi:hypothetical protein